MKNAKIWLLTLLLVLGTLSSASCGNDDGKGKSSDKPTLERIASRGVLLVGTTGDYRPLSYLEPSTGEYWGFGIDMANEIARQLGVKVSFVKTSWPTLTADVMAEPQTFDFAIAWNNHYRCAERNHADVGWLSEKRQDYTLPGR